MIIRPKAKFTAKLVKEGNATDECEDQFVGSQTNGIFALADGATDAAYSKVWAELLVNSFCKESEKSLDGWLDAAIGDWNLFEVNIQESDVPWFTLEKLSNGSAATFLGVSFDLVKQPDGHILWRATAVGDTCLFIVQEDVLRLSFPIETSDEFSNAPRLLRTIFPYNKHNLLIRTGTASYGDRFFLMTDALAHWFLRSYEKGDSPWLKLVNFNNTLEFESFITEERITKKMKNDDVSLVIIDLEDS